VYPMGQSLRQLSSEVLPAADCGLFSGQDLQVEAELAEIVDEYLPAPHSTQVLSVVLPVPIEYVPAGQFWHEVEPVDVV